MVLLLQSDFLIISSLVDGHTLQASMGNIEVGMLLALRHTLQASMGNIEVGVLLLSGNYPKTLYPNHSASQWRVECTDK